MSQCDRAPSNQTSRSAQDVRSRFALGDPDSVRAVYQRYGRLVYAVAYKLLGDRDLAEQATQRTFVSAWRASSSFDTTRELEPWLVTIARRAAIDIHRHQGRRRADVALEDVDPAAEGLISLPSSVESVYEVWELRKALGELSLEQQQLIKLAHFEGLSHAEIATRLEVPIGTVKSRMFRARQRLAAMLGHLRQDPSGPRDRAS